MTGNCHPSCLQLEHFGTAFVTSFLWPWFEDMLCNLDCLKHTAAFVLQPSHQTGTLILGISANPCIMYSAEVWKFFLFPQCKRMVTVSQYYMIQVEKIMDMANSYQKMNINWRSGCKLWSSPWKSNVPHTHPPPWPPHPFFPPFCKNCTLLPALAPYIFIGHKCTDSSNMDTILRDAGLYTRIIFTIFPLLSLPQLSIGRENTSRTLWTE